MSDINDDTMNSTLYDELGNAVKVITGITNRLAVDATISGDESPTKYGLRWDIDSTGSAVTTTDTSLYSFSGAPGILDSVAMSAGTANYEAIIKIDGTERFRTSMSDLGALGLSNAINVPVWAETANKNFRLNPNDGFGFENSFEVLARATVGSTTIEHAIMYREKT